jgi:ankyrin repeat protein
VWRSLADAPIGVGARTPLPEAAQRGNFEAVIILLSFGAHVWIQIEISSTSLHHAVKAEKTEMVRMLLEWCPDSITTRNNEEEQ